MAKNLPKTGKSARHGNIASTYPTKHHLPYTYPGQRRLARGDLQVKANTRTTNKYL